MTIARRTRTGCSSRRVFAWRTRASAGLLVVLLAACSGSGSKDGATGGGVATGGSASGGAATVGASEMTGGTGASATGGSTGGLANATGGSAEGGGPGSATGGAAGGTGGSTPSGGTAGSRTGGGSGGTGGAAPHTGGTSGTSSCGVGDANMPAEPTLPAACATLEAAFAVTAAPPSEATLDTSRLQAALGGCEAGKAVRLVASSDKNGFITGPLTIPAGVTLWVDTGVTLFGTRDPKVYGSAAALITVQGAKSGIVGEGVIDGQGGEPKLDGSASWWEDNANGGNSPALILVSGASDFVLYRITLHNSPKFHVKLGSAGFVVWGVTIQTPSKATNSAGTALSYKSAHNTDGIDPGQAASNGFIVCSRISVGDDHIAIKGSSNTGVSNLIIAHNHFGAGHGMSIGSEFTGGVSKIRVYDLSIDGTGTNTSGGGSNGLRIKSDSSRGGLVNDVVYSDICLRDISNPILLTPTYSTATGTKIPQYTNITFQNIHLVAGGSNTPTVTLDGYDDAHLNDITLDNVIMEGLTASNLHASYTKVTLGPGAVDFMPSGTGVTVANKVAGTSTPNPCTGKWVAF